MGFLDQLAANPRGSSVYNPGGAQSNDYSSALNAIRTAKDQDMNDFKEKAQFMENMSIRQDRLRQLFDPSRPGVMPQNGMMPQQMSQQMPQQGMDVIFKDNAANQITPFQKEGLSLDKQRLGLDQQKLTSSNRLGEERIGIAQQGADLNVQKNQQIYETRQAELAQKTQVAEANLEIAKQRLQQQGQTAETTAVLRQAQMDAQAARFELQNSQKDAQLEEQKRVNTARMGNDATRTQQAGMPTTQTTELNEDGNKRTTTTTKGAQRIKVTGPNGQTGTVDANDTLPSGWKKAQ